MKMKPACSAFDDLTLLDVSPLFGETREDITVFDMSMNEQLFEEGGFVITGFPGAEEMDALGAKMLRFFDLPEEEKDRLAVGSKNPANSHL